MKTIIIVTAYWTATAVGDFWGWLAASAAIAITYAIAERKEA